MTNLPHPIPYQGSKRLLAGSILGVLVGRRVRRLYEPFAGSGTTIIAAEMLGRHCMAIEIDPKYVAVSLERWQSFTGLSAIDLGTGKPWTGPGPT